MSINHLIAPELANLIDISFIHSRNHIVTPRRVTTVTGYSRDVLSDTVFLRTKVTYFFRNGARTSFKVSIQFTDETVNNLPNLSPHSSLHSSPPIPSSPSYHPTSPTAFSSPPVIHQSPESIQEYLPVPTSPPPRPPRRSNRISTGGRNPIRRHRSTPYPVPSHPELPLLEPPDYLRIPFDPRHQTVPVRDLHSPNSPNTDNAILQEQSSGADL